MIHRRTINFCIACPAIAGIALTLAVHALAAEPSPRVDNPYDDAALYINDDYVQQVLVEAAMAPPERVAAMLDVATQSTAVWLDRVERLYAPEHREGASSEASSALATFSAGPTRRGLEQHLLDALTQDRARHDEAAAMTITLVVYNLPDRDCAARASNGELHGRDGFDSYQREFIDPIAALLGDPRFASLRIVAILEPDSLPNLVTNLDDPNCAEAADLYRQGIGYAIRQLSVLDNVYVYLDMGHSGWLGWPENRRQAVALYRDIVAASGDLSNIAGVATNVSGYTPTEEFFLPEPGQRVGGAEIKTARFFEYNPIFDERRFATSLDAEFEALGFPSSFGVLVDTSRNGWGGHDRPAGPSESSDIDTFVDQTRLDRRHARGHWCNQRGAGIGERPASWPFGENEAIHALLWIKPPGESDGASQEAAVRQSESGRDNEGKPSVADRAIIVRAGLDSNCDPGGQADSGLATGAFGGAPPAGDWFSAQFQELVANAAPPLGTRPDIHGDELEPRLKLLRSRLGL